MAPRGPRCDTHHPTAVLNSVAALNRFTPHNLLTRGPATTRMRQRSASLLPLGSEVLGVAATPPVFFAHPHSDGLVDHVKGIIFARRRLPSSSFDSYIIAMGKQSLVLLFLLSLVVAVSVVIVISEDQAIAQLRNDLAKSQMVIVLQHNDNEVLQARLTDLEEKAARKKTE